MHSKSLNLAEIIYILKPFLVQEIYIEMCSKRA